MGRYSLSRLQGPEEVGGSPRQGQGFCWGTGCALPAARLPLALVVLLSCRLQRCSPMRGRGAGMGLQEPGSWSCGVMEAAGSGL